MTTKKISELTPLTPLSTDLVPLDRPVVGSGAPVTGRATLGQVQSFINSGVDEYWESSAAGSIFTTGSVLFRTALDSESSPADYGVDNFFYVSGSIGSKDGSSPGVATFGGDVHISGNLSIDGIGVGGENYFWSPSDPFVETSGSLAITGSFRALSLSASNGATITGSLVQGFDVDASGLYSHAQGEQTTATGRAAHAEGLETEANGDYSHSEGYLSEANGDYSHTEGIRASTNLSALGAHAEGRDTVANGIISHAEGDNTTAYGEGSHAEGWGTIASGSYQHVQGKYNLRNNDFSLFVIGDGIGDTDAQRGDIVRVNSGSAIGSGRVEVTGTIAATIGLSGSLTKLVDGSDYLIAGTNITLTTGSNGAITVDSVGGGGLETGKQFIAPYAITALTSPQVIGQFSWVPSDYSSLSQVELRAILSTDGTVNHTGSLQVFNLTSGSFVDLLDSPVNAHLTFTGSNPTLFSSRNLLDPFTNFDNSQTCVYEVRVSGSSGDSVIVGGVELVFS